MQIVLAGVFLAVVIQTLTSVSQMSTEVQARLADVDNRSNLEVSINSIASSPEICGLALGGQTLAINNLSKVQPVSIHLSPSTSLPGLSVLKAGTLIGSLEITKINFIFTPTPAVIRSRTPPIMEQTGGGSSDGSQSSSGGGSRRNRRSGGGAGSPVYTSSDGLTFTGDLTISVISKKSGFPLRDFVFPLVVSTTTGTGTYGQIKSCMSSQLWQSLSSLQVCPQYAGVVGFSKDGRLICRQGPPGPQGPAGGNGTNGSCTGGAPSMNSMCTPGGWVTN